MSDMCAALKVTRQGYYAWKSRPPSAHALRDEELAIAISQVGDEVRGIYGAPKTFMRLRALGVRTSRKRVPRIMRERGWRGVTRACAKRPSGEKRASKRESALDLVGRRFEAGGPNMAWFSDITYVKTRQGWLYLALVMDIWSRRIAGWSMVPNITAELADEALKMALVRRNPPEGCVHHSDYGPQYVSLLQSKTMRENGIRPSMGSISSPWDNVAMESLMGIVKSECVHARTYAAREEAALDLFERVEVIYMPRIDNVRAYSKRLLGKCMARAGKPHYLKGEPESQLLMEDAFAMADLPPKPFRVVRVGSAKTGKYGDAIVDGRHRYPLGPERGQRRVIVELGAFEASFYEPDGSPIATFGRAYGDAPTRASDPMSQLALLCRKPGGWRNSAVRASIPESLSRAMDAMGKADRGAMLRMMRDGARIRASTRRYAPWPPCRAAACPARPTSRSRPRASPTAAAR